MLKSLIAVGLASILITQPPQNTNDGTYYQDVNITESYEYKTNEVNSIDDLIVGNIYHLEFDNALYPNIPFRLYYSDVFNFEYTEINGLARYSISEYGFLSYGNNTGSLGILKSGTDCYAITLYANYKIELDFIFSSYNNDFLNNNAIQFVSASEYLGEKTITVEPVETEGLYNLAYHFLYSRIYTNTELQGMETTLFGATINMNMWLAHTTAIVIICLLLIVLIKFVLWLFKIVSGGMLWK